MILRAALAGLALLLCAAAPAPRLATPSPGAATRYVAALRKLVVPHLPPAARPVLTTHGPFDIALLDPAALAGGCADGRLAHLDWTKLGGKGRFLPAASSDCGVGAYISALALAWRASRSSPPLQWPDLWNVAQMPGRRALPATPVGTLEIALMADGVAPRDVYPQLASPAGVARAFRKLTQLRPYIVWWHSDAEALRILGAGGARMAAAPADLIAAARPSGVYALQTQDAVYSVESLALAKTSAAYTLIVAATEPARQAAITRATGLAGTGLAQAGMAPPGTALWCDGNFWRDHGGALQRQFSAWLAAH